MFSKAKSLRPDLTIQAKFWQALQSSFCGLRILHFKGSTELIKPIYSMTIGYSIATIRSACTIHLTSFDHLWDEFTAVVEKKCKVQQEGSERGRRIS